MVCSVTFGSNPCIPFPIVVRMTGWINNTKPMAEHNNIILRECNLKNVKTRRRSNVVEKFRKVSDSVWVSFEAVVTENTLKEK